MGYTPAQITEARSDAGPLALQYIEELEDRLKKISEVCNVLLQSDQQETNAQIDELQTRLDFCDHLIAKWERTPPGLKRFRTELQDSLQALHEAQDTQKELARVLSI